MIDYTLEAATGSEGTRVTPYHCPFCGDEDLRPHSATSGEWECRACLRAFRLSLMGLLRPATSRSGGPVPADQSEDPA